MLEDFFEQLPQPDLAEDQYALACFRNFVDPTSSIAGDLVARTQKAISLQSMQDRVQRAWTQHVAVKGESFNDADAEDGARVRVVEDMESNKAGH